MNQHLSIDTDCLTLDVTLELCNRGISTANAHTSCMKSCIVHAGRHMLAGKEPSRAPFDDDTSTIEDNVTFLNSGKGTPTAKQTARSDINAAGGRLGSPTSRAQV
jgi:hypothetical protein